MEGKALIMQQFGGIDAIPICLDTKDEEEIIHIAKSIAPAFGAINLEDLLKAGVHFKLWIADSFAWINNKMGGDLEKIRKD
jgi:malic enzyme